MVFPKRSQGAFSCTIFSLEDMWLSRTGSRRAKGRRPSEGSLPELQVSSSFSNMTMRGSVWVMRGTVGIHGATHEGMNSKPYQLEISWFFSPRSFRSPKIHNRNAGNAEMFIRNAGWIFGTSTKLCVLDLFLWPVGWHVLCSGGFCVLITHCKDSFQSGISIPVTCIQGCQWGSRKYWDCA